MKKILSLFLALFFVIRFIKSYNPDYIRLQKNDLNYVKGYHEVSEDNYYKYCPSVNVGRSDGIVNCPVSNDYYCKPFFDLDGEEPTKNNSLLTPQDCFSQHLYRRNRQYYFNKCCYVRYQIEGTIYNGCAGMTDDQMWDINTAISDLRQYSSEYLRKELYISEIYCKGSFIVGSLFIALFSLLL